MSTLAPTLEAFFTERLMAQRRASPNTIAAYRDAFRLLLVFIRDRSGIRPDRLSLTDLDAAVVGAFLDHLERDRGAAVSTRNARLSAVHSFFRYAALRHPEHAGLIQRVLAIPAKRADRGPISYRTDAEIDALLAAPERSTRLGRRDSALLALASRPGFASPSSSACAAETSPSVPAPTSPARARGGSIAARRSPPRPRTSSAPGCGKRAAGLTTPCFPDLAVTPSPATRSGG